MLEIPRQPWQQQDEQTGFPVQTRYQTQSQICYASGEYAFETNALRGDTAPYTGQLPTSIEAKHLFFKVFLTRIFMKFQKDPVGVH